MSRYFTDGTPHRWQPQQPLDHSADHTDTPPSTFQGLMGVSHIPLYSAWYTQTVLAVVLDKGAELGLQNPQSVRRGLTPAGCLLFAVACKGAFERTIN